MPSRPRAAGLLVVLVTALATGLGGQAPTAAAAPGTSPPATPASPAQTRTASPSPTASATPSPSASATPGRSPRPVQPSAPGDAPVAASSGSLAAPRLAVQVAVDPGTINRSGQPVTVTVAVSNTGGQPLRDTVVSAVAPNLHALTCTPVAQGGTLAAGATTTCTGTRTSTQEDLRSHGGAVSATAAGFAPDGSPTSATAAARLASATRAPRVTDDLVQVVHSAPYVILPATTNDLPDVLGGPALDPSRTELKSPTATDWPQYRKAFPQRWQVLADGSVKFIVPVTSPQYGYTDSIQYRSIDSAGQSALGTLTVVVREGAAARNDTATTRQGASVLVDILKNDSPGMDRDGSRATFDEGRLRFADDQPDGLAQLADGGRTVVVPRKGTFKVSGDRVAFSPDRSYVGKASFAYEAADTVGNTVRATAEVTVTPVVPTVTAGTAVTTYLRHVAVPWLSHARPGSPGTTIGFGGFTSSDGTNVGVQRDTAQGSWYSPVFGDVSGYVDFWPAAGFSGVAATSFEVVDSNGSRATGTLRVTVRRGWSARPDSASTTAGADVTIDPLANDVANQRLDGSPGHFDLARLAFDDSGQPAGSTLSGGGKQITLPGRGSAWISNGKVTFRPQPGFTGSVGRLTLAVYDDSSQGIVSPLDTLLDRVTVIVRSGAPAATDDSATTVLDRPVTLPGSTNDDPGSASRPLPTTFPTSGQPTGSVVSAKGRALTVPGQGVWSVQASGTATFAPEPGFVGGTAPVLYRVQGAGGASATAMLSVSVQRGPVAAADTFERLRDMRSTTVLDPLANDLPGFDAGGMLGTIDPASVRFPLDGQPAGSVVSSDGRVLTVPANGVARAEFYTADPQTGRVELQTTVPRLGPIPRVTYEVQDSVVDPGGAVVHHRATGTLQVTYTGRDLVATDDSVTAVNGDWIRLPGATNDLPGSGTLLTGDSPSFPADQLGSLPAGSTITYCCPGGHASWTAEVPGEGRWHLDPNDGSVSFEGFEGFVGTTTPVRYRIDDSAGGSDDALLSVTVLGFVPATLRADTATTRQGVSVSVRPLANDTAARRTDGTPVPFDVDRLEFVSYPDVGTVPEGSEEHELVVAGEGRYSIAFATGVLTFRPDPTFRGTTSPVLLTQQGETSTFQVDVEPVDPIARNDSATTSPGSPVRLRVVANDAAGTASRPLVAGSVRLRTVTGLPSGATLSADAQLLTIPGRGVFAAAGDGTVTFYPLTGATGTVPTVGYEVADVNGSTTAARVAVRVA